VTSENTDHSRSQDPETTSENTEHQGRGAQPTPLPGDYADFLEEYAAALRDVPLAEDTKRTYVSRVRMYLAWLASSTASRRSKDPLTNPKARDWAVSPCRNSRSGRKTCPHRTG
jgi:hypothetical protein